MNGVITFFAFTTFLLSAPAFAGMNCSDTKWESHPHLKMACQVLEVGSQSLALANDHEPGEYDGHRDKAEKLVEQAQSEILQALGYAESEGTPGGSPRDADPTDPCKDALGHPDLHHACRSLITAKMALAAANNGSSPPFGGHRDQAQMLLDQAKDEIFAAVAVQVGDHHSPTPSSTVTPDASAKDPGPSAAIPHTND